jgi:hypothetical protein
MQISQTRRKTEFSVISWCLSLLGGFWIGYLVLFGCDGLGEAFLTLSSFLLLLSLLLALMAPYLPWLCPILMFAAVGVGVFTFDMIDTSMDHNLSGIEVIGAYIMALPGSAIGGVVGTFLSLKIWRERKGSTPA